MSGHSKWSTIKRKKGAADAKRGKIFSKLAKEITVAAKMGGGDPAGNPRLRTVLNAARIANMPKENVKNAILKGTGELPGVSYEEVRYEGYGADGVAIIVDLLTDNRNRAVAEIRHIFSKNGGNLAENGAVTWNFEQKGRLYLPKEAGTEEEVFEKVSEAGAEDVNFDGEQYEVITAPTDLHAVAGALEEAGLEVRDAALTMIPKNTTTVSGKSAAAVLRLIEALEENDDVQYVYSNFDISEEEMAAAMGD